jgi:enoyl-CoA hydratase
MLTGARVGAARAYDLGLTPVAPVAVGAVLDEAVAVAETIAAQGPYAVRSILESLRSSAADRSGLQMEAGLAIRAISGRESTEGVGAFLERRPPAFADREVAR